MELLSVMSLSQRTQPISEVAEAAWRKQISGGTGPSGLQVERTWPVDILDKPTKESQAEAKLVRKVLAVAVDEEDERAYYANFICGKPYACVRGCKDSRTTLSAAEVKRVSRDR